MQLTPPTSLASYTQDDLLDIATVARSTLESSTLSILRFGKVPPEESLQWLLKSLESGLDEQEKHPKIAPDGPQDPHLQHEEHLVVRDLDLPTCSGNTSHGGRIVAHAEWRYNPSTARTTRSQSNSQASESEGLPPPPAANTALVTHFNGLVEDAITAHFSGVANYELRNISTAISHLRRGIAKQLVSWIFPFADRDQLPVILAASPPGRRLYRACGFDEIVDTDGNAVAAKVDMAEWGGEGEHLHVLMVRWPAGHEGTRNWEEYRRSKRTKP